jgi:hypothetical protein
MQRKSTAQPKKIRAKTAKSKPSAPATKKTPALTKRGNFNPRGALGATSGY